MHIPNLFCPFPSQTNEHAATVDAAAVAWAKRWHLTDTTGYQQLSHLRLGWLAAQTNPMASLPNLQLVADWCTWLFLHDDFCDESHLAAQPERLEQWHHTLLAIMAGQRFDDGSRGLVGGFTNLWQRTTHAATPEWTARFRTSIHDFFNASAWEAGNRATGSVPTVATYMAKRPLTSGMYMYIDLIDVTHALSLPPSLADHPVLAKARQHTARAACWVNDILSYSKELARGDPHNLVITLATHHGLTYPSALAQAVTLHDAEVQAFIEIEQQLLQQRGAVGGMVRRYFDVLRSYLRGNLDWTSQSIRYAAAQAAHAPLLPTEQRSLGQ